MHNDCTFSHNLKDFAKAVADYLEKLVHSSGI